MKFSEIPYERITPEDLSPQFSALCERVKQADSKDAALEAFRDFETLNDRWDTQAALAHIHFTLDTEDQFWADENDFYDEVSPSFTKMVQDFYEVLLASRFRLEMEAVLGPLLFKNLEIMMTTFSPEILPDLQEENRLSTAYVKLISSAQIEFDGKMLTLSQLAPYEQSTSRLVRRNACETKAAFFMKHAEELDRLYDELVRVRTKMAHTLGFPSFVELGYARLGRNCYDREDVRRFREKVRTQIVPLCAQLKAAQARRLSVERLMIYDDPLLFPTGNACPHGTPEEIFAHGKTMYHELSPETAEFMDYMLERELFDVLSRKGKSGGGYCTYLPDQKAPFIFANFNGTAHDIDVLTHEAGHALAAFLARDIPVSELRNPTMETCEVHSMSMEFFTWPWMEGFFEDAEKYRFGHLSAAVTFLPYGVMVDAFQEAVYSQPEMTPEGRRALWLSLEREFRPWLDFSEVPFLALGGRWQMQAHIYEMPFYYIDYCLAQTVALSFWVDRQRDPALTWTRYLGLVRDAGRKTFLTLLAEAGVQSPFEDGALREVALSASQWLSAHNPEQRVTVNG